MKGLVGKMGLYITAASFSMMGCDVSFQVVCVAFMLLCGISSQIDSYTWLNFFLPAVVLCFCVCIEGVKVL